jgi:mono/diheme cytochrome c family protein
MNKKMVLGFLMIPLILIFSSSFKNYSGKNPIISTAVQQQKMPGEIVFKKYCISCHQADGGGVPNIAPPLQQTSYVLGEKETLINIVLNGLKNVEINEETYNNPMPALGSVLKDKEIADVLTYVRNSFGNKASAVSSAEVKKARTQLANKSE